MRAAGPDACLLRFENPQELARCGVAAVDLGGTACKMPSRSDDSLIFSLVVGSLGQMTWPLASSRLASCRVTSMTPHWLQ